MTFLHLNFYTLSPTVYPFIVELYGWIGYIQPTIWEPRGLFFGEICVVWLVRACSRCSSSKGGGSLQGPSYSCSARFGMTHRLRPARKWSNTIIHAGGYIIVIFVFSFFLLPWPNEASWRHNTFKIYALAESHLCSGTVCFLFWNCGLETDFVVLWLAGYLACARCAASGSIIAVDALATADGAVAPTTSQRCPNCMGATKVLIMVYLFLFAFVFVKHHSVLESFQVPNLRCKSCMRSKWGFPFSLRDYIGSPNYISSWTSNGVYISSAQSNLIITCTHCWEGIIWSAMIELKVEQYCRLVKRILELG